ncbi:uncharacterized protein [Rutidosis leptorrhynchoides]|uniref:uncharacterized protein n=1 Tax=Rutidosis leptorrhynchoides TaxID=125765 RepID=UPI003A98F225
MRKPTGHMEKYSVKSEISRTYDDDGTAARTRPFSYEEIMLRRKKKKETENIDQPVVLKVGVSDCVESDKHVRREGGGGRKESESVKDQRVVSGAVASGRVESDKYGHRECGGGKKESGSVKDQRVVSEVTFSGRVDSDKHRHMEGGGGKKESGSVKDQRVVSVVTVSGRFESDKHRHREGGGGGGIKESGSVKDQRVVSDVTVSGRVESDKHRHREGGGGIKESGCVKDQRVVSEVAVSARVESDKQRHKEGGGGGGEKESGSFKDQRVVSEVAVSGRVESDKHRHREGGGGGGQKESGSFKDQRVVSEVAISGRVEYDKHRHREGGGGGGEKESGSVKDQRVVSELAVSGRVESDKHRHRKGGRGEKESGSVKDQRVVSELAVSGRVESDKHRHREGGGGGEKESGSVKDQRVVSEVAVSGRVEFDKHRHREGGGGGKKESGSVKDQRVASEVVASGRVVSDKHRHREGGGGGGGSSGKKESGSAKDQRVVSEVVYGRVESVRQRYGDTGGNELRDYKETKRVSSRAKEDKPKMREDKIVEREYKKSSNANIRSKIVNDDTKDGQKERSVHEKRKNQDRSTDEVDHEHVKRRAKDSAGKDSDRNVNRDREKFEHVSKRRTENGYDERGRDHESRNRHDYDASDRKEKKSTSEHREDIKSRRKRSRSREPERDKSRRSVSPSPQEHKQRLHDARDNEHLSSKDRNMSNNGSSSKSMRHDTSSSRLGGYSPRKRRTEAAVKTTSPISQSPPVKMESVLPLINKTELSNRHEVSGTVPIAPFMPKPTYGVLSLNASVDSVQLTQATRPKRRIYVENLPSSATEEAVMKWLNGFLRPYGVNHAQGASPCISCIVNKEKGQAVVEFLTPEDASIALSLDGKLFAGNILNIRRPKDYVETTTGVVSEKPVAGVVSVKNIVEDSPNKIFIGGISKVITSDMLMEIASAFGPLKAYHFECNADLDSPCAFIEYADQSVTVKARAGLNGMKLGGKVLTVTQATQDASLVEKHDNKPFYGTPVHAQPLLGKPTQILKFDNVVDPHSLSSLPESEIEELLEDIRLECARFGMVKSVNIIKQTSMPTTSETINVPKEANSTVNEVTEPSSSDTEQHKEVKEPMDVNNRYDDKQTDINNEPEKVNTADDNGIDGNKQESNATKDETDDTTMVDSVIENQNQTSSAIDQSELNDRKRTEDTETENEPTKRETQDTVKDESHELSEAFKAGCVLVEYKRTEASSMAAHCLHGRDFDGRTVSVEYVPFDVYRTRFKK